MDVMSYAEMLIDAPVPGPNPKQDARDRHNYLLGFEAAMDLGIEVAREADKEIAELEGSRHARGEDALQQLGAIVFTIAVAENLPAAETLVGTIEAADAEIERLKSELAKAHAALQRGAR